MVDLASIEEYINSLDGISTQGEFDAIVSFVFNVGVGNYKRSTFSKTLDVKELSKWVYASGKKLGGLVKRRKDEALLFTKKDSIVKHWEFSYVYNIKNI